MLDFSSLRSREFAIGLAMSIPVLTILIPGRLAIILLAPLLLQIVSAKTRLTSARMDIPTLTLLVLGALHLLMVFISPTPYQSTVLLSLVWSAIALFPMFFLAQPQNLNQVEDIFDGFFWPVCLVATVFAIIGVLKFILQINGFVVGSLINQCGVLYPQGTTVCGDYNLYALVMAIAYTGLSYRLLRYQGSRLQLFLLQTCLALVATAGFFAGSRRFFFIFFITLLVWAAHCLWRRAAPRLFKLVLYPVLLASSLYIYLDFPHTAIPDNKVKTLESLLFSSDQILSLGDVRDNDYWLAARSVSIGDLADTMSASNEYGLEPRIQRWKYAYSIARENIWTGVGYSYHQLFSCEFNECKFMDYPHASILSAWLALGVVGLILSLVFYTVIVVNVIRSGKLGLIYGATPIALCIIPYSLTSGDTVFSLPHIVTAVILVRICSSKNLVADTKDVGAL